MRGILEMQPPKHSLLPGKRVVVLNKIDIDPLLGKHLAIKCLDEKSPVVPVHDRLDDKCAGQFCLNKFHGFSSWHDHYRSLKEISILTRRRY